MLLKDKLNITQEEQNYLTNELFQKFKNMMNDHGLEKVSKQVENMLKYNVDNISEFNITYNQIITYNQPLTVKDIEILLKIFREEKNK